MPKKEKQAGDHKKKHDAIVIANDDVIPGEQYG